MNPSDEPFLACENLTCGYASREVLRDVRLTLAKGASVVLLGPNGSGKSTFLKTLCKTISPLAGKVRISGENIEQLSFSELAKLVAFVPQEELPPFRFTVRQVVLMGRMPLSPGFFDSEMDHQMTESAMEEADCVHLADRPITEISGGERQRALIARALAQEAPLLLLDEPTSHLDAGHQVAIVRLVRRLRDQGRTFLIALHDLNLAAEFGEQAVLIQEGQMKLNAPTEDVLKSSALDSAYGIQFDRFSDATGRLRLFAKV